MIMCPYCLTIQEPLQTNLCNNPQCEHNKLPPKYVENARRGNLTSLGTFGLPSHGKSALLASIMYSVRDVHKIVTGSYIRPLDEDTQKFLHELLAAYRAGNVQLPSTPLNERPRPLLVMDSKFSTKDSTVLVAYDLAGEVLKKAGSQPEYVRALNKVNTIWFVVSLDDLVHHNSEGYTLDSLLHIYLDAMADLHISIRDKNILVVYTKADILLSLKVGLEPLPLEVEEYLHADPYAQIRETRGTGLPPFDEDAYFAKMCEISDILQDYTNECVDGGAAFITEVEEAGAHVYFTLNSAYGSAPDPHGNIGVQVQAIRVLDTLIWAIKLNRQDETGQQVALIVPATIGNTGLTSQATISRFYEEMSSQGGHVATYYPGQIEPAFPLGTSPIDVQSSSHLPLIGPILDRLQPKAAVVLLVDEAWPMDVSDLNASRWRERLLAVVSRRELVETWLPHCRVLVNDGDITQMVSAFLTSLA